MIYVPPQILTTHYGSSGGAMSIFLSPFLYLILAIVMYSLWKNGKFKTNKKIPGTVIGLIIGIILLAISLIGSNPIYLQVSVSLIAVSSFLAIKSVKAKRAGFEPKTYYPSYLAVVIIFYVIISTGFFTLIAIISEGDFEAFIYLFISIFSLLISAPIVALYFLPYLIANKRGHQQTRAIYILNIFAGWTVVAWIIALIWAHTIPNEHIHVHQAAHSNAEEILQYKKLHDSGVISDEEYKAKKKQLLDL